jgi:hypothetical protein
MPVRPIWQKIDNISFDELRAYIEGPFREALAFLSDSLRVVNDERRIYTGLLADRVRSYAWPLVPEIDYMQSETGGGRRNLIEEYDGRFLLRMFDSGWFEFIPIGNKLEITLYCQFAGAEPHLLPVLALFLVSVELLEGEFETRGARDYRDKLRTEFGRLHYDGLNSPSESVGLIVFDSFIYHMGKWNGRGSYYQYMKRVAIRRVVKDSLESLVGMKKWRNLRKPISLAFGILLLLLSAAWVIFDPGLEQLITFVAGIGSLLYSLLEKA